MWRSNLNTLKTYFKARNFDCSNDHTRHQKYDFLNFTFVPTKSDYDCSFWSSIHSFLPLLLLYHPLSLLFINLYAFTGIEGVESLYTCSCRDDVVQLRESIQVIAEALVLLMKHFYFILALREPFTWLFNSVLYNSNWFDQQRLQVAFPPWNGQRCFWIYTWHLGLAFLLVS